LSEIRTDVAVRPWAAPLTKKRSGWLTSGVARLHQHLMRLLLSDIARGVLGENERLPAEAELARQFGASRGVVREALRSLEERGVIKVHHGRGAVVTPPRRWNLLDADVLGAVLETPASANVLHEFLECRRILEVEAAGLAAVRATVEDLSRLADAFARMTASAERAPSLIAEDLFHEADVAFHGAIFQAAENRILSRIVEPIQRALQTARRPLARPQARIERAIPEHRAILTAIAAHEPEAARAAMLAHLETIEGYLREYRDHVGASR
jgi:GntR family galactonate operon transcriptional repressor